MDFRFSSLARGDVSADIDEGADVVVLVSRGSDRDLKVHVHRWLAKRA